MNIGYTIVSINDDRRAKKDAIQSYVGYPEVRGIHYVNGRDPYTIENYFAANPDLRLEQSNRTRGELGIWFSLINCWKWLAKQKKYDALIIFEDDAVIHPLFKQITEEFLEELPADFDMFSMFVPDNQLQDYEYKVRFDRTGVPVHDIGVRENPYDIGKETISRSYQGYSCVCMMWSRAGAQKMLDIVKEKGMYSPVDCQIFLEANLRNLNVYSPLPEWECPVSYDWDNSPTLVHDTYPYEGSDLP